MTTLTLAEVERELLRIADDINCYDADRLRALARRIAVQVEMDQLVR